jgi:CheY-like chemotaxis protein
MNGLELQRQLAVGNLHIPIVFVTAYAADNRRTQALEAGAVAFLYKPFLEGELLNAIDAALKDS